MRIAVSVDTDGGLETAVSPHFGRCPYYTLVDVEGNSVTAVQTVSNPFYPQHEPGAIPKFIYEQNVNVMLTGGMGQRAVGFFMQYGIQPVTGATGTVRQAVEAYMQGQIAGATPCHESAHGCDGHHDH